VKAAASRYMSPALTLLFGWVERIYQGQMINKKDDSP
jgi:hypothetical protein